MTATGEVSLDQPSLGGSYAGVNPMGLFTLMTPPPGSAPDWFLYPEAGYDVTLQASVGGRVAATATVRRQGPTAIGVAGRRLRPTRGGIYPSLALAYFKAPGLPRTLHNIPLEYFTSALEVLRAQPGVDPRRVLVPGSRGAAKPRCCSAPTFPRWSTASSPGCPARW